MRICSMVLIWLIVSANFAADVRFIKVIQDYAGLPLIKKALAVYGTGTKRKMNGPWNSAPLKQPML